MIVVREARDGDEAEIANVHLNSWREAYRDLLPHAYLNQLPMTFRQRQKWWKHVIANPSDFVLLIAETKTSIIGFACFNPGRETELRQQAELAAIYLFEKFKGVGIGSILLSSGFQIMAQRGFSSAYCWVLEGNPTIQFYERSGAKPNGEIKTDTIGGISVNELCYTWETIEDKHNLWNQLSVEQLSVHLKNLKCEWIIAGGWAIDLFLKQNTRIHSDIDVLIQREHQHMLHDCLSTWELWVSDPPGTLRIWKKEEYLGKGIQDIWCRRSANDPWEIQFMLFDTDGEDWIYKRDNSIRQAKQLITTIAESGLKYLSPEIQLLYKSKSVRAKDQFDFHNTLPALSKQQKQWLHSALTKVYHGSHVWLKKLD